MTSGTILGLVSLGKAGQINPIIGQTGNEEGGRGRFIQISHNREVVWYKLNHAHANVGEITDAERSKEENDSVAKELHRQNRAGFAGLVASS